MRGNEYARYIFHGLRHIVEMLLFDFLCRHDCYIRIRVDLLLRCTARSNDHLI